MVGNGREVPAQNGLAMIASAIIIARDLSTAQMLIVIFSRNMIKNCVHVDKKGICQICGAECKSKSCDCRKYVVFQGYKAHIFHAGIHSCTAKKLTQRPSDVVQGVLSTDPNMKPSAMQSSVILKAIRERRPWKGVMSITDVVCNAKDISNEKIKQGEVLQPDGTSFAGTDKHLIYKVSINEE